MENRIKEILSEKGMTAKELASNVGVSSVSLYNIINGKQEASANTLNIIAEKLSVPFWQLFVSPDEVNPKEGTIGIIRHNGKTYEINSISDIERSLSEIKGEGFMPDHKNIRGKNYFK